MVNQTETSPVQAKGLINIVSDKLILKAAEIYPLLVMGLEAATLSRNNYYQIQQE